jgi:L-alanine-DL-glutamate epimerase-like enolase superfamily enzyme
MTGMGHDQPAIDELETAAFTIPTQEPEADGTLAWSATTLVTVRVRSGAVTGLGFSYATGACVTLVRDVLADVVVGRDAMDVGGAWLAMVRAIRNVGRPGVASMAIAAVDTALWDLKARLLGMPLVRLFGQCRESAPIYGSGGFTSYSEAELTAQLSGWVHEEHIPRVKMKIGTDRGTCPERDVARVRLARKAVGDDAELYVDANGAYTAKQAVRLGRTFDQEGVSWFEEPVSSDDLTGLAEVRARVDADVAAGEYGYDLAYFERMAAAGAVDVLQADVSRCAGFTEWLRVAAVAAAHGLEISGHCAPSLHVHVACAVPNLRHLEYFVDHARLDRIAFDGVLDPRQGSLRPDLSRPGMGLELREADMTRYRTA